MAKISVDVEAGRVQRIDGIPTDLYVEARNCNVDGLSQSASTQHENGRACEVREQVFAATEDRVFHQR
jgi:hypothetical protein